MIGGDHVDRAVDEAFQQSLLIGLVPQGRIHLEAALVLQIILTEQQIVRPCFAGHVYALGLGLPDERHGFLAGDVAHVVGAACFLRQMKVALDLSPIRSRTECRECHALRHSGPRGSRRPWGSGTYPRNERRSCRPPPCSAPWRCAVERLGLHAASVIGEARHAADHGGHVGQLALALLPKRDTGVRHGADARVAADRSPPRPPECSGVSGAGFRLGMGQTVVYPPWAAARVPVSTVSL